MYDMLKWAQDLFPIPRSLTGDGVRRTLDYLQTINDELVVHSFPSGATVFDWEVPQEWNIRDAWFEHIESGERFAIFSECNLHILGYSVPVDKVIPKTELLNHIYTQPDQPNLIPYVTSYYKERWGFCIAEEQKQLLPEGDYHVYIDSDHTQGELLVADALVSGASKNEIMFSSYICHPSMANNELSGPVLLSALLRYIREYIPNPNYSYRFILVPETIGSLAYMSRNLDCMKNNIFAGYNLSCVGDDRAYSHVKSRFGNNISDKALQSALLGKEDVKQYSFLERGSDERQYCAPGIDLPICGFCRSKYGEYPEYHTSADDFNVVTASGLAGSFETMKAIIDAFEMGIYPKAVVMGEPQLGKRGLYPTLSQKGQANSIRTRMNFLAYADGVTNIFEICEIISAPLET